MVMDPKYKKVGTAPDLVLFKTAEPGFTFNEYVKPICLPKKEIPDNKLCTVAGWGKLAGKHCNYLFIILSISQQLVSISKKTFWKVTAKFQPYTALLFTIKG